VIDSGYGDAMASAMLEQIRRISDRPVRYVINTNSQPHRVLGNAVYKRSGAEVIAAEGASARMSAEGQSMASAAEGIPDLPAGSIGAPGAPGGNRAGSGWRHLAADPGGDRAHRG